MSIHYHLFNNRVLWVACVRCMCVSSVLPVPWACWEDYNEDGLRRELRACETFRSTSNDHHHISLLPAGFSLLSFSLLSDSLYTFFLLYAISLPPLTHCIPLKLPSFLLQNFLCQSWSPSGPYSFWGISEAILKPLLPSLSPPPLHPLPFHFPSFLSFPSCHPLPRLFCSPQLTTLFTFLLCFVLYRFSSTFIYPQCSHNPLSPSCLFPLLLILLILFASTPLLCHSSAFIFFYCVTFLSLDLFITCAAHNKLPPTPSLRRSTAFICFSLRNFHFLVSLLSIPST